MKNRRGQRCFLFIGLCLVTLLASAHLYQGTYFSLSGAYVYVPKQTINISTSPTTRIEYKHAYAIFPELGYAYKPLRYSLEYMYSTASIKDLEQGGNVNYAAGHTQVNAGLANVYFDFVNLSPDLVPYLGVGIGYAHVHTHSNTNVVDDHVDTTHGVFAYQGIIGVKYHITHRWDFSLDYRYFATAKINYQLKDSTGATFASESHPYKQHIFSVGFAYQF